MSDTIGLDDNPLLKCWHGAASALSPSINSDPGSCVLCCSSGPCGGPKQAGAVQPPRHWYLFRGKMGCHLEELSFSNDDKSLDNLDILNTRFLVWLKLGKRIPASGIQWLHESGFINHSCC